VRLAELCAGFGGLHLGLQLAGLPVNLAWHAENDADASTVMAAHHPGIPNLGDITTADWAAAEPVDILCAGFPCQGFSLAGKRRGSADERHLWPTGVLPAIAALTPPALFFENVPGLLTIERGEVWRTILNDLDRLGYTVRWTTIGACKVGLCHHRHRVFILATRQVGELPPELGMPISAWSRGRRRNPWPRDGVCAGGLVWAEPTDHCHVTGLLFPTPTVRDADRGSGWGDQTGRPLSEVVAMLPTPTSSDGQGGSGHGGRDGSQNLRTAVTLLPTPTTVDAHADTGAGVRRDGLDGVPNLRTAIAMLPTPLAHAADRGMPSPRLAAERMDSGRRMLDDAIALLPTPTATPYGNNQSDSPNAAVRLSLNALAPLLPTPRASDGIKGGPNQRGSSGDLALPSAVQPERWAQYAEAVWWHELITGMRAPDPTIVGKRGGRRLSPHLTEWMQALPPGWITGPVPDPNAANKIAGNGVAVPAVAAAARRLLDRAGWATLPSPACVGGAA
jgi:DNA (cytosine-5)-methyltransferase 1